MKLAGNVLLINIDTELKVETAQNENFMMLRLDSRIENQLRPLTYELGLITEANGSCKLTSGHSSAISRVYGPSQPKYGRHENIEKGTFEVEISLAGYTHDIQDISRKSPSSALLSSSLNLKKEQSMIDYIKSSLENVIILTKFPKLFILIQITLLNDDGASLPLCLNAAVIALLDASIPLLSIPLSLQISQISLRNNENDLQNAKSSDQSYFVVDPTKAEERNSKSKFVFTYIYSYSSSADIEAKLVNDTQPKQIYDILSSDCKGVYRLEDLTHASAIGVMQVELIHKFMREVMENK